jgi:cation diffusion facilitator family transporter
MRGGEHSHGGSGGHHDHPHPADHGAHHHDRHGLKAAITEVFRPHSHDAADVVDSALEANRRGMRALAISFVALAATAAVQVLVIVATGSVALLADTIHNFSDALTAVPLFIAFRLSRRPPTRRYTYGYRRAEDLAGIFIVMMIALSAVIAAYQAVDRLIHPRPIHNIGWLFAIGMVGFVGNELVALYRIRVGRQIGSAALTADGLHARTDGFTSLAVSLGAGGVWLGWEQADPFVGLAISVALFAVLRVAAVQVFHRLMDAVDPAIVDQVEEVAARSAHVERVESVRVRWAGHRLRASVGVVVDEDLTVRQAHTVEETVRANLLAAVRHLDSVDIHLDPCGHSGLGAPVAAIPGVPS